MDSNLIAILIALVAAVPGLVTGIAAYKRAGAETTSSTVKDALELLEGYKTERAELRSQLDEERKKLTDVERRLEILEETARQCEEARRELVMGVGVLTRQVESLGSLPNYRGAPG